MSAKYSQQSFHHRRSSPNTITIRRSLSFQHRAGPSATTPRCTRQARLSIVIPHRTMQSDDRYAAHILLLVDLFSHPPKTRGVGLVFGMIVRGGLLLVARDTPFPLEAFLSQAPLFMGAAAPLHLHIVLFWLRLGTRRYHNKAIQKNLVQRS